MEVTRVLPPGEQQPVDCAVFARLCRRAIWRALEDLRDVYVPEGYWTVFFSEEPPVARMGSTVYPSQMGSKEARGPRYRDKVVWDRIAEIWQSGEFTEFADYLWDRAALKNTFSGPDPGKLAWARYAFGELVHTPLLVALEATAREKLVDGRAVEPWELDEARIEEVVADTVAMYCERRGVAIGRCPQEGLKLPPGFVTALAHDLTLRHLSKRDRCLFLSRYHWEFVWDDFKSPLAQDVMIEVKRTMHAQIAHFSLSDRRGR